MSNSGDFYGWEVKKSSMSVSNYFYNNPT